MYRLNDIKTAWKGLVGWRQPFDPNKHLDGDLARSQSGLYFQDAHPLLTLDNIRSIMPEDFLYQYADWNSDTPYPKGAKVKYQNVIWIARLANTNVTPASDYNDDYSTEDFGGTTWRRYDFLSDYVRYLTEMGITQTVQNFFTTKQLNKETRNLLEHKCLFDGAGRIKATIENKGRLVGYQIEPVRSMGITTHINRIGLQMAGAQGSVMLYLFHSSQPTPIRTKECYIDNPNGGYKWFDVNWDLPYIGNDTNNGGCWYVCYNQPDLPRWMEAVNIARDWTREPCGTCNVGNAQVWREMQKYFSVMPFLANAGADFADMPALPDIADIVITNTTSWGINLDISVGCDLTDFLINQKSMFADVIQKQVAVSILRTIALNPNVVVNRNQANVTRDNILYELDGNTESNRPQGLGYDLKRAYKAIDLDTKGLDRLCLACQTHGIKIKAT